MSKCDNTSPCLSQNKTCRYTHLAINFNPAGIVELLLFSALFLFLKPKFFLKSIFASRKTVTAKPIICRQKNLRETEKKAIT